VLAGGALAAAGFRKKSPADRRSPCRLDLVRRGATGPQLPYEAFGVRTAPRARRQHLVPYELRRAYRPDRHHDRPPEEVYRFWRQFSNLPRFMRNLESVREMEGNDRTGR